MATELVKRLKAVGISDGTDGLLINYAGQKNRNNPVIIDCIDIAIKKYEERLEALQFLKDDILKGRV